MSCIGRFGRDEGATAILVALLTLFVLLPLAALGTTAFIRATTVAELSLAADAGALAGAANIPVGDLQFLVTYLGDQIPDVGDTCEAVPPPPPVTETVDDVSCTDPSDTIDEAIDEAIAGINPDAAQSPTDIACDQARAALKSNGRIGDAFDSDDSGDPIFCHAEYLSDPDFLTAFGDCVNVVQDNPLGDALIGLADTLPALLKPGIKVTLERGVDPPLESLLGSASSKHKVVSAARRQFKNAIVLPIVPGTSPNIDVGGTVIVGDSGATVTVGVGATTTAIDLNDAFELRETREEVLRNLDDVDNRIDDYNNMTVPPLGTPLPDFPSECRGVLPALRDDFVDVANPPDEGSTTVLEILGEPDPMNPEDRNALVLRLFSGTPFFDFVPVCVDRSGGELVGLTNPTGIGCTANAPGAFRAALVPAPP